MTARFYTFSADEVVQEIIAEELAAIRAASPGMAPSMSGAIRNLIKRTAAVPKKEARRPKQ